MSGEDFYNSYNQNLYATSTVVSTSAISMLQPGTSQMMNTIVQTENLDSGVSTANTPQATGAATRQGKATFDNNVTGYILGLDPKDGYAKFYIGSSTSYLNWTGTQLLIAGNITSSSIDIPDSVTANSFHVDSSGNMWIGSTTFATALFSVSNTGNVVAASLRRKDFHWFTVFESIDGYQSVPSGTGSVSVSRTGVTLNTGATAGSESQLMKGPTGGFTSVFSWTKQRSIKFTITVPTTTNNPIINIGTGDIDTLTNTHFGFNIIGTTINSSVGNGTNGREVDLSTSIVAGTPVTLEAIFTPGVDVKYYVDDVLKFTETTYIPTGTDFPFQLFDAKIENGGAAVDRSVIIHMYDLWQAN